MSLLEQEQVRFVHYVLTKVKNTKLCRRDHLTWCFQEGMANSGCYRKVPYSDESGVLKTLIAQASLANSWRICQRTNNA